MTIYEIDYKILDCIDAETGEIINEKALNDLQMSRDEKIENVACWIKDLVAEGAALKAEKMSLEARQKTAENKVKSLKKWLAYALDGQKFNSTRAAVSFRHNKSVSVPDIYKLDENYVKYAEPTADKTAIKEAINAGQTVAGAEIVDSISTIIK